MPELKTQKTDLSVSDYIAKIENAQKRKDCEEILQMMEEISGSEPKIWGGSIVGFGDFHYKYASGREGDWFKTGFSARKTNITLYFGVHVPFKEGEADLFGKHKSGMGCVYINKLADVNIPLLKELISRAVNQAGKLFPAE